MGKGEGAGERQVLTYSGVYWLTPHRVISTVSALVQVGPVLEFEPGQQRVGRGFSDGHEGGWCCPWTPSSLAEASMFSRLSPAFGRSAAHLAFINVLPCAYIAFNTL